MLTTSALIPATVHAQVNYKVFPVTQLIFINGSTQTGHYDECNNILFDCSGNIVLNNPPGIKQKIIDNLGCPENGDPDGDGIVDEDKCPNDSGYKRYKGCPIPDTDKDGVNDEEDKCINDPGPLSNFGCPEMIVCNLRPCVAPAMVFFVSNSNIPSREMKTVITRQVKILKDHPDYYLVVEGHTDSIGEYDANLKISGKRAMFIADMIVAAGIDRSRLRVEGFGADRPIATNKTTTGRAHNRRVELKLRNYPF